MHRSQSLMGLARFAPQSATLALGLGIALAGPSGRAIAADETAFTATFSNGVTVDLIGLSTNPSRGQAWWTPDGTPVDGAPYADVRARMGPKQVGITREMCWRWRNIGERDVKTDVSIEPTYHSAGGGRAYDDRGDRIKDLTAWAFGLPDVETCTVRLSMSVPSTAWSTLMEQQGDSWSSQSTNLPSGEQAGIAYSRPRRDGADTVVVVSYRVPGQEVRVAAVADDGKVHIGKSESGSGVLGFTQREVRFADVDPDQLKQWRLQVRTRKTETVEFRNVSLHRGQITDVEVVPEYDDIQDESANERRRRLHQEVIQRLVDEHGYRLAQGQLLKYIAAPPEKERQALYQFMQQGLWDARPRTPEEEPNFESFVLVFRTDGEGRGQLSSSHTQVPTLESVLEIVLNLKPQQMECKTPVLNTYLPGDWILSWNPQEFHRPNEAEVAAFATILNEHFDLGVRLHWRDVERSTIVVTGKYKFSPRLKPDGTPDILTGPVSKQADGNLLIPQRRSDIAGKVGDYQEFLQAVGEVLMTPVVDEATERPAKPSLFWRYEGTPVTDRQPLDEATERHLLESLSLQTGLTFSRETRPVKTLVIDAAD